MQSMKLDFQTHALNNKRYEIAFIEQLNMMTTSSLDIA